MIGDERVGRLWNTADSKAAFSTPCLAVTTLSTPEIRNQREDALLAETAL